MLIGFAGLWYVLSLVKAVNVGKKPLGRFGAILLLVVALGVGLRYIWFLHNPETGTFYKANLAFSGRRVLYAHYATAIGPAVLLLIIGLVEKFFKPSPPDY